jgi:Neprosin
MVTSAAENGAEGASPATFDPPMNEDGHVLKSRRGLLAAGLAVAVVGALGVASTLNAGADQIPGDQDVLQAPAAATADATEEASAPPVTLPWGDRPARVHRGRAGTSSRVLRDEGLQAAADTGPHRDFAPKGKSMRGTFLKSEQTDFQPPAPAASPSAGTDPTTAPDTTSPTTTSPTVTTPPTAAPTRTAPVVPLAATSSPSDVTTPVTPPPTATPSGKDSDVSFLYSVASQAASADGIYAAMDIKRPVLAKGDYHTLAELTAQSADSQQIVEVGWNVDRAVNGDDDPHLFVFHWVNGQSTCYNTCDFQPYDGGVAPGSTLPVDTIKKFGIQYYNGAWWVAYDTTWVGSFPDKDWTSQGVAFTKGGFFQAFGEVAAASPKPCTQMGSGLAVDDAGAARIGSITFVNGPTTAMNMRTTTDVYGMNPLTAKTFRYGGPGAC